MYEANTRCPLQSECDRKCTYHHHERDCNYYRGNSRPGMDIPDQEKLIVDEYETAMSAANILSASPTAIQPEPDMIQVNSSLLVQLPVESLFPHPYNPRKDLGDLTELADSIKANGILQNLTVIPMELVDPGSTIELGDNCYVVIIGHRRLAAAKLAGLTEVPCVITEMGDNEQIQTMLMENIQRTDLTVYEQAQGFQMMLDLGDSVETISEKSGFSKSTIRHRVKLLELDQEKFKASVERGATLQDYVELEKIEDQALKNEVLDAIGTNNFRMALNNAIQKEKNQKYIAEVIAAVSEFATLVEKADYSIMEYVTGYDVWNKKEFAERPEDASTLKYYYTTNSQSVTLFREKAKSAIAVDTEKQEALAQRRAEFDRIKGELKKVSETAYDLRADFIKKFSSAKKNLTPIIKFAASVIVGDGGYSRDQVNTELLAELLGLELDDQTDYPTFKAMVEAYSTNHPEYTLLASAYASVDSSDNYYFDFRWVDGANSCVYYSNEDLDRLYDFLISLGYEMSDVEKALRDGTHELFQKPVPAPRSEQEGDAQ